MKYISQDDLHRFYILENHSISECATHFKVSRTSIKNRISKFNLHKNAELTNACRIRNAISTAQSQEAVAKRKSTILKKYGVDNPMKNKTIMDKAKATNIIKYGHESPMQNRQIVEKAEKTNLERYGVENVFQNKAIAEKAHNTCLAKYGNIVPLASDRKDELLEKRRSTTREKYGADEIVTSAYFKDKVRSDSLEKYGLENPRQNPLTMTIFHSEENLRAYIAEHYANSKPTSKELLENLNCSDTYLLKKFHELHCDDLISLHAHTSSYEKEIIEYLKLSCGITDHEIERNNRSILNGLELDIIIPSHRIAIEFNGAYWHSELFKDKYYHQEKSLACADAGYRLIHIYESDWLYDNDRTKEFLSDVFTGRECAQVREKTNGVIEISGKVTQAELGKIIHERNPLIIIAMVNLDRYNGEGYKSLGFKFKKRLQPKLLWADENNRMHTHKPKGRKAIKIYNAGYEKYILNLER